MQRIYIEPENIIDTEMTFSIEQSHRISTVLRLKAGDSIIVFDGQGKEYRVILKKVKTNEIIGIIESMTLINRDPKLEITLIQGLPKFEKMDSIVQKATELGVKRIIPVITTRTIPSLTLQKTKLRLDRWQKIAISAAEQSGRTIIPLISPITNLDQGLLEIDSINLKLFFWEEERSVTLKSVLQKIDARNAAAIIIGPEGGFTKEEAKLAKQSEAISVSLGSQLLRTETAPIAALSILLYEFS